MKITSLLPLAAAASLGGLPAPAQGDTPRPIVAVEAVEGAEAAQVPYLRTMIESAIVATNRFTVLDSTHYDELRASQERCKAGMVAARDGKCQVGKFVDPDYRIAATVTAARITRSDNVLLIECHSARALLSIDIRITDKSTGQFMASGHIDQKGKDHTNCGQNSAPPQVSLEEVGRDAAEAVAAKLVFATSPIEVLALPSPGKVLLNYGQEVMAVGSKYDLFAPVQAVKDSRGNSYMVDNKVGTIAVVSTGPTTSVGALLCTVGGALPQPGFTARPAADPNARAVKPAKGQSTPGEC